MAFFVQKEVRLFSTMRNLKKTYKKAPVMLVSEYGELMNVKPMTKPKPEPQFREVQLINDNTDAKTLLKKLNHNPKTFFLFDPKGHFSNAQALYGAMKKRVHEVYYGGPKKKDAEDSLKGTVFEKCALPYEIFNVNRMAKNNVKQALSRLGFLALRDGSLQVAEKNRPELPELRGVLAELEREVQLADFAKPDYFAPFPFVEGVISFEVMRSQGIRVRCLQDRMIYPYYGVWSPTSQEYLDLVANYAKQVQKTLGSYATLADLGCGTGVLPIVLNQVGGFQGKIFAFDKEAASVECARHNGQVFGLADKLQALEIDLHGSLRST